jgi:hypothetical protein
VYWDWQSDGSDSFSREVFRKNVLTEEQQQLTNSDCASYLPMPGQEEVVFYRGCEGDTVGTMYYLDIDDLETHLISSEANGNPGGFDFDGMKWVVWVDEVGTSVVNWLWKYDVLNGVGPTLVQSGMTQITWPKIDDGKVYSGIWDSPADLTNKCDVRVHDLDTNVGNWVFSSPWDQIGPTVSGNVLAYEDTEELAHNWFEDQTSYLELYDLDTGVTRKLTDVAFGYTGIARHDKYFAYNAGDLLILCDLEAGGFIDSTGHVCPEGGCPELDGGVDGGADAGE